MFKNNETLKTAIIMGLAWSSFGQYVSAIVLAPGVITNQAQVLRRITPGGGGILAGGPTLGNGEACG